MRLTQKTLDIIRADTRIKNLLALELGRSVYTVQRWIEGNSDDLTKAAALKIIREEIGLSDKDILEEDTDKNGSVKLTRKQQSVNTI